MAPACQCPIHRPSTKIIEMIYGTLDTSDAVKGIETLDICGKSQ